ncbi:transcription factor S [Candidatus Woesearchaeota archaeon]|nr:transcription factor S [Candidatus Woesearchaeota archaeon]
MQFCPKCGGMMMPKKKDNKTIIACPKCGYESKDAESVKITEKKDKEPELEIVEEGKEETYPLIDAECPRCRHNKAYFWTIQTRASDEPETKFFKCEKCKHTWRDYS